MKGFKNQKNISNIIGIYDILKAENIEEQVA